MNPMTFSASSGHYLTLNFGLSVGLFTRPPRRTVAASGTLENKSQTRGRTHWSLDPLVTPGPAVFAGSRGQKGGRKGTDDSSGVSSKKGSCRPVPLEILTAAAFCNAIGILKDGRALAQMDNPFK